MKTLVALVAALGAASGSAQAQPTLISKPGNLQTWPAPQTLSPEARAAVEAMGRTPLPSPWPPVAAQRAFADTYQAQLGAALQKRYGVRVEQSSIGGVPVRIVYPKGVTGLGRGPVLINLHGGGFTLDSGSLSETIPIAALSGVPVVAVLYRLAPEHPFPAAVDDALAVYQTLARTHGAKHIAVFGTSAGAGLGAQLMARLGRQKLPMPAALGFFSGSADLARTADSETWQPLPTDANTLAGMMSDYIGKTALDDPALSPSYGKLSDFPPTLLVTSSRDFLLSGTVNFARALEKQGVITRLVVFDGLPHAFWAYMPTAESDEANGIMADYLRGRVMVTADDIGLKVRN